MTNIDTRRRRLLKIAGGAGTVGLSGLAGCIGESEGDAQETGTTEDGSDGGEGTGTTEDGSGAENQDVNVGMVYATGGLGDKSFNDMAQKGAQKAKDEYGISFDEAEPETNSDFTRAQRDYAESGDYDLISCIGYAQADALSDNAPAYPEQNFMLVDAVVDQPNVANYRFREQDGSFQVGHLAGLLTSSDFSAGAGETNPDEKVVGFVGGTESPLIQKFEAGFRAGVEHADEEVEVVTSYVGGFNDTAGGKETALTMYQDSGADIVYHAAGATGVGVFQAAQQAGRYAIGVDDDQSLSEPDFADVILASMVKRVDTAVYTEIENVVQGDFQGGGEPQVLGLDDDAVQTAYGDQLGSEIPDDVKSALEESRQAIIDGDIEVPDQPE